LLDKIWDKDDKIPTGKQVSDIREALRVAWFNSITGDNPPEPVSSEDEGTKTERLTTAHAKKIDKFHPMYLYLYFHFGSTGVGDCDSPYFPETAEAIQLVSREEYGSPVAMRRRKAPILKQNGMTCGSCPRAYREVFLEMPGRREAPQG
jgi:hypothetical protein